MIHEFIDDFEIVHVYKSQINLIYVDIKNLALRHKTQINLMYVDIKNLALRHKT